MCVVSFVYELAQTAPQVWWTAPKLDEYREIMKHLEDIDRKLGQPDCGVKHREEFERRIEERLKKLEDRIVS